MKRLTLVSLFFLSTLPLAHATSESHFHYLVSCHGPAVIAHSVFEEDFRIGAMTLETSDFHANFPLEFGSSREPGVNFIGRVLPNHTIAISFPMDAFKQNVTYKGHFVVKDSSTNETLTDDADCKTYIQVVIPHD